MIGNIKIFILTISMLLLLGWDCKKPPPPEHHNPRYVPTIQLTVVDTGVIDLTLKVTFLDTAVHRTFTLKRDSIMLGVTPAVGGLDTTVLDGALQPNHTYHYTLYRTLNGQNADSSKVQVTTMDTTSHNFTWQMDTLGDGNSSVLRDVAIIDENNVWAVGEIYLKDSTGSFDTYPYGLAHWDGIQWHLIKVPYHDYGTTTTYPGPLYAVFAFSSTDVFVSSSANLLHWDGSSWTEKAFFMTGIPFNGQVRRMWGTSDSNIYCVGNSGAIYHYNGSTWSKIESGTTSDIHDIWGMVDAKTGKPFILAAVSNVAQPGEKKLIQIKDNFTIETIYTSSALRSVTSVWFENPFHLLITGGGVFTRNPKYVWRELIDLNTIPYTTDQVRGHGINDMFIVGDFGTVAHYNGVSLKIYNEVNTADVYGTVAYNGNVMVTVGLIGTQAVILRMYR